MNVPRRLIPAAAAAVTALALVPLSACSDPPGAAGGTEDGKLRVVASFYPMEFLAEEIGGRHVSVTTLTEPGVEPHDFELSPRQTAELGEAGLVVYLRGLQDAVDEAVAQSGVEHTVDAAALTRTGSAGGAGHGDGHGGEEHEGDHPEGADPHLWLDPVRYAEAARGVGRAMAKADPDNAPTYRKNTRDLVAELDALHREYRTGLKNRSTDTFITTHAAFGHLADRYGLDQESIAGLDPESEPSPARIRDLHRIAREEKVSTVFFETIASSRTARTLAQDTGLTTDVLDPVEGIKPGVSRGDDYLEVMRANLKALRQALGAT